jgi:hypothetical protein
LQTEIFQSEDENVFLTILGDDEVIPSVGAIGRSDMYQRNEIKTRNPTSPFRKSKSKANKQI